MFQIGIDMGGTFTDFIVTHEGDVRTVKIPSDKKRPIVTVINGLKQIADSYDLTLEEFLPQINRFVHGNTVAINALIQREGVKTALIATDGFRDALEIRRSKLDNQWDFFAPIPPVLVPRYLRYNLKERVDYSGKIIQELDQNNLEEIVAALHTEKVESVAVCLLFSFLNDAHEKFVKAFIEKSLPHVFVSLSSEVAPKLGEYERASTTVLNAYLTPLVSDYLSELKLILQAKGLFCNIQLVQNSGGLTDSSVAKQFGVKGLLSGPAAGSSGAQALARELSEPNLVLVDMGGTSFDVSLIKDHRIKVIPEAEVSGYPVNLPLIDINSVGIGGGSIASVDASGRLGVGPDSAEAFPGPACYDRGGKEPTITDAALILGFIKPNRFGGGSMELKREIAFQAIKEKVAVPLNIRVEEAALAIYQIAEAKMADAVHLMTVQKGYDPREFVLGAAGGASPLFAAKIAQDLGVKKVVIPAYGEVFCAQGMLQSRLKLDMVQSYLCSLTNVDIYEINEVLKQLTYHAQEQLIKQGVTSENIDYRFSFEMRYTDQHHQLSVSFTGGELDRKSIDYLICKFHLLHEKHYGYAEPSQECSLINIRLEAWEKELSSFFWVNSSAAIKPASTPIEHRKICWNRNLTFKEVPVYQSLNIKSGSEIIGPALIEKAYTTIFVTPNFKAHTDSNLNIILTKKEVNSN
ncbi:hydantoinase/oxoprolinase family protein [Geosporobacter ferrireducens]|uniref:hydantoinase/oxoprolinase family protein n=1 Tax=Geosporobacter ferrireducens TaxID=1424294 RepID=UPI00139E4DE6|nr:hydantoinase/oxoprolinase family protein [Geosporobacter ferrireducens]MTI55915.1 hydantoinase/oxoprolinase family protein [Geosporobacter ferrireducens]